MGKPRKKPTRQRLRVRLYPYQQRWVEDDSRFKIACKARQIGFTFAAALRVVRKRLARPGLTLWIAASERQSLEAMEHIRRHVRAAGAVASYSEEFIEYAEVKQRQVRLANGSRVVALPANPDTMRGFAGDVVLDEFAFHRDAEAIWRAAFATATRGFQLEIISTPNGTRGKYYQLARDAGLVDFSASCSNALGRAGACPPPDFGTAPFDFPPLDSASLDVARDKRGRQGKPGRARPSASSASFASFASFASSASSASIWSAHWVDLATARAHDFVVDVESLRAAIADEDAWQQEYCCGFLSHVAHYIPPELAVAAEHPAATTSLPLSRAQARDLLAGPLYLGVDIGRRRDLTVLWLLEVQNEFAPSDARHYLTRAVFVLDRQPFAQQRQALDALLALRLPAEAGDENRKTKLENRDPNPVFAFQFSNFAAPFAVRRCAIDATGLGAMLAEELQTKWGARVEPVTFTLATKEDLAVRVKRLLEEGRLKLPADPAVRAALGAVKRYVTSAGNLRFDADRTEATAHADHFWALALALLAAEEPALSLECIPSRTARAFSQTYAF